MTAVSETSSSVWRFSFSGFNHVSFFSHLFVTGFHYLPVFVFFCLNLNLSLSIYLFLSPTPPPPHPHPPPLSLSLPFSLCLSVSLSLFLSLSLHVSLSPSRSVISIFLSLSLLVHLHLFFLSLETYLASRPSHSPPPFKYFGKPFFCNPLWIKYKGITVGREIGLLWKITYWSLLAIKLTERFGSALEHRNSASTRFRRTINPSFR